MRRIFWFFWVFWLATPASLWARDFQICSGFGQEKIFVSYGYEIQRTWVSQGWFLVRSGRCLSFVAPLEGGRFYYFAYNEDKTIKYEGDQPFCVDSKPFRVEITSPSKANCKNQSFALRLFRSFDLTKDTHKTRLILEPPQGPEVVPVPYQRAEPAQLQQWAAGGDGNAKAELERRVDQERLSALRPSQGNEDMMENESKPTDDKGAFKME